MIIISIVVIVVFFFLAGIENRELIKSILRVEYVQRQNISISLDCSIFGHFKP